MPACDPGSLLGERGKRAVAKALPPEPRRGGSYTIRLRARPTDTPRVIIFCHVGVRGHGSAEEHVLGHREARRANVRGPYRVTKWTRPRDTHTYVCPQPSWSAGVGPCTTSRSLPAGAIYRLLKWLYIVKFLTKRKAWDDPTRTGISGWTALSSYPGEESHGAVGVLHYVLLYYGRPQRRATIVIGVLTYCCTVFWLN